MKASTRQAAEKREGEGAAITHWPRDSELEGLLDKKIVVTQHQKCSVHTD